MTPRSRGVAPPAEARVVSWFSAGAASAVATKLAIETYGKHVIPVYVNPGSEHEDNVRFLAEIEGWLGMPIVRVRSDRYGDTWQGCRYLVMARSVCCN